MPYHIKLEQFEGPLELLLQLTEDQKLDITRLSLAKVADQYLEYISSRENVSLENLAQFLSVAAKLILIKSKALLPLLEFTEEEEEEIKDLELQLAEYKKFKDIAKVLGAMMTPGQIAYSRESFSGLQEVFYPPEKVGQKELEMTFRKFLSTSLPEEKLEEEMVDEILTLEEKIHTLQETLKGRASMSFSQFVAGASDKIEVVVSFLAMLEMVKQRIIHVQQEELFSEIQLKHNPDQHVSGGDHAV